MGWTDRIRETVRQHTLEALFGDRAPLVEALATVDAAALTLALDELGWLKISGPTGTGNRDFPDLDRTEMVRRSRLYYYRDPLARQAIRLFTTYALGQGITVRHTDARAQRFLDQVKAAPGNHQEIGPVGLHVRSDQTLVDGEWFLAVITANRAAPQIRHFDALEITELVTNPDDYADVWYVTRTTPGGAGQPARVRYYRSASAVWGGADEEQALEALPPEKAAAIRRLRVPDVRVIHVPINTIGRRGYPHLCAMLDWAKVTREFMENRATITKASAQFAFKKKVKGGAATVNALAQAQRTGQAAAGQAPNPGYDRRGAAMGSTHVANEAVEFEQFRFDTGAGNAREDARLLKLHAIMAVGMAEHYFGDATNGNLATATAMERPVELALAAYQLVLKEALTTAYTLILQAAGYSADGLSVVTPPILNIDKAALLTALTGLIQTVPAFNIPALQTKILAAADVEDVDAALRALRGEPDPPAADPAGEVPTQHLGQVPLFFPLQPAQRGNL